MQGFDLVGVGHAVVDVLARVPHGFVSHEGLLPGSMRLVDAETARALTARLPERTLSSGGSVANTCAVAARLGARVAFLGQVAADDMGTAFATDIRAAGVHYPTTPLNRGEPTATCVILVTPDGQRTMNTHLGIAPSILADPANLPIIGQADLMFLEGYLLDAPDATARLHGLVRHAKQAGRRVALSLSDAFCVQRNRATIHALLPLIDLVFANEAEITSLYEANRFETARDRARADVALAVLTRSEQGSLIVAGPETIEISAIPTPVVDSTGAGDCYAAGFLAGLARGESLAACGQMASEIASRAVAHFGARPPADQLPRPKYA